jgi:hypothetical protein
MTGCGLSWVSREANDMTDIANVQEVVQPPIAAAQPRPGAPWWRAALGAPSTAVTVIWLTTGLVSAFAPDMVTGSQQDHLPIAALSVWLWASLATAYTLMGASRTDSAIGLVVGISAVWTSVLIAAIGAPVMVTGTDPARIPMAVLVAPVVGAITTGFLALHHATQRGSAR